MRRSGQRFWRLGVLAAVSVSIVVVGGLLVPVETPAQDIELDLDSILRCVDTDADTCAEARTIIVEACTNCHTIAPIVLQQFDAGGWRGLLDRHRVLAPQLDDAQIATIETYLAANFNESMDPPELPEALLRAWTDY